MAQLITFLHILTAIAVIILVLMQHGKGADVGAAFGSGASNTMFGSVGTTSFLMKLTASLAAIFFLTSLSLSFFAVSAERNNANSILERTLSQPIPLSTTPSPASTSGSPTVPAKKAN